MKINKRGAAVRVAFPTDEHYPFQDDYARALALKLVEDFKPDVMITGSDGMDFYSVSTFAKDPERVAANRLQAEIDAWQRGQMEWCTASPGAQRIFLIGNHEDRLRKYLWHQASALSGLRALEISNLLNFSSLAIAPEPQTEIVIQGQLVIKHGSLVRKHSAATAKAEMESEFHQYSVMTGHTHRGGTYYATTRDGVKRADECFCLCRLDPEYVRNPNWQQGIVFATVTAAGVDVESIPFTGGGRKRRAFWRGREWSN